MTHVSRAVLLCGALVMGSSAAHAAIVSGRVVRAAGGSVVPNVDLDFDDTVTGARLVTSNDSTHADGTFAVTVPNGVYRIHFNPPFADRLAGRTLPNVAVSTDVNLGDVSLDAGAVLSGRIVTASGAGVATVDLDADDSFTGERIPTSGDDTNESGFFQFVVPFHVLDITVEPPKSSRLVSARLLGVNVPSDVNLGTITVASGFLISGRVQRNDGSGIALAEVNLYDATTGARIPTADDIADATGAYSVVSPVGSVNIVAEAALGSGVAHLESTGIAVSGDRVINLTLAPTLVSGDLEETGRLARSGADYFFTVGVKNNSPATQPLTVTVLARDARGGAAATIVGPVQRSVPGSFGPQFARLRFHVPGSIPPRFRGRPLNLVLVVQDGTGQTVLDTDRVEFRIP